jgi:hypothetical protein
MSHQDPTSLIVLSCPGAFSSSVIRKYRPWVLGQGAAAGWTITELIPSHVAMPLALHSSCIESGCHLHVGGDRETNL